MAWKHNALSFLFLSIDVNATNQDSIATIEKDEKNEAANVSDPTGQFRIVRQQPEIQRVPYAAPDVDSPQKAQKKKNIRDHQANQALKTRADISHQRLQAKRHDDYKIPDSLEFDNEITTLFFYYIYRSIYLFRLMIQELYIYFY